MNKPTWDDILVALDPAPIELVIKSFGNDDDLHIVRDDNGETIWQGKGSEIRRNADGDAIVEVPRGVGIKFESNKHSPIPFVPAMKIGSLE